MTDQNTSDPLDDSRDGHLDPSCGICSEQPHEPAEIIAQANQLAREFYRLRGYEVPEGYRFDKATHPHEVMCWHQAEAAYAELRATELGEVLAELDD